MTWPCFFSQEGVRLLSLCACVHAREGERRAAVVSGRNRLSLVCALAFSTRNVAPRAESQEPRITDGEQNSLAFVQLWHIAAMIPYMYVYIRVHAREISKPFRILLSWETNNVPRMVGPPISLDFEIWLLLSFYLFFFPFTRKSLGNLSRRPRTRETSSSLFLEFLFLRTNTNGG